MGTTRFNGSSSVDNSGCDPLDRFGDLSRRTSDLEMLQARTRKLGAQVYELAVVSDLHEALASVLSVEELLDVILERCTSMVDAQEGSIFLFDPSSDELVLRAAKGRLSETIIGLRQQLGQGVAGYVASEREPVLVSDIEADGRFPARRSKRYVSGSFLSTPMVEGDRLVGVINVSGKSDRRSFDADDLKDVLLAANYSAGVLGNLSKDDPRGDFGRSLHAQIDGALERLNATNRELALLRECNQAMFQSIPLGLVAFDDGYKELFTNGMARELLGLGGDDNLKRCLEQLDVQQPGRDWPGELAQVLSSGNEMRFDEAILRVPGSDRQRTARMIVSPLRDDGGGVCGGVIVIEDITENVRLEREIAASEHHAVIGKLAARVAHEVNNPLDGIMRFVNLSLAIPPKNSTVVGYLGDCKTGLERMAGIVSSLLEFSRNRPPARRGVDANHAIIEAVEMMRPRGQALSVQINCDLAPDLRPMPCGEVVQVMMNLLKNAFDAMPSGGEVSIITRAEDEMILIEVADTGEGMPGHVLRRVFDPFFTTKPPSKGTGLGLAICRQIIGKYNGTIGVESEPGAGTTFRIAIPVP